MLILSHFINIFARRREGSKLNDIMNRSCGACCMVTETTVTPTQRRWTSWRIWSSSSSQIWRTRPWRSAARTESRYHSTSAFLSFRLCNLYHSTQCTILQWNAVLWICIDFNEDPNPLFLYLNADLDPGNQTNADPCINECTKYFFKGRKRGLFVNFGKFPCSWIQIRIPNMDPDPGEPIRTRVHNTGETFWYGSTVGMILSQNRRTETNTS